MRLGLLLVLYSTSAAIAQNKTARGQYHIILKTQKVLSSDELLTLKELGAQNLKYKNDSTYYLSIHSSLRDFTSRLDSNIGILAEPTPSSKLGYSLKQKLENHPQDQDIEIAIEWNQKPSNLTTVLDPEVCQILHSTYLTDRHSVVRISPSYLLKLASLPEIRTMDFYQGEPEKLNVFSRRLIGSAYATNPVSLGGRGLTGEGITVGVGDNCNVYDHVDLKDRLINYNPYPGGAHGYHVSGTALGSGIMRHRFRGVLPKATLVSAYFSDILSYTPLYVQQHDMTITNNSYGQSRFGDCSSYGVYDLSSYALDELINNYPTVSHIFAAGNSGVDSCGTQPVGYFKVYGQYQSAKNTITVGNLYRVDSLSDYSSRGPLALDRRLKPDITAVGSLVYSLNKDDSYWYDWGTSMAAPALAGITGILQQEYKRKHSSIPHSDLIKALLLNGAYDIMTKGPDVRTGYGRASTYRSLQMIDHDSYLIDTVSMGDSVTYTLDIKPGTAIAKILLYYHDIEGSPSPYKALTNDLDLYIKDPSGNVLLPLIIDASTDSSIFIPAKPGLDTINNTEQIVIENPTPGSYTLVVKGTKVVNAQQRFVVAIDTIAPHIFIRSPQKHQTYISGANEILYWDNYYNDTTATTTLEYSLDGGSSWIPIIAGLPWTQCYYTWPPIESGADGIRIRVTSTAGLQATSEVFVTNPLLKIRKSKAASQCPGSCRIYWTANPNFTDYLIYRKIGDKMQIIDSTTSSFYIYKNLSTTDYEYLTVQPRKGQLRAERAYSIRVIANYGDCALPDYQGDLTLLAIEGAENGRAYTLSSHTASDTLGFRYKNQSANSAYTASLNYNIDNTGWQQVSLGNLAPGVEDVFTVQGIDFSAIGQHTVEAYIENTSGTDPLDSNNALIVSFRQIDNPVDDLQTVWTEGFESSDTVIRKPVLGILGAEAFDFESSTSLGRVRSYYMHGASHAGDKALTLDVHHYDDSSNTNYLRLTKNLSTLQVNQDDVRLDFYYAHHGQDTIFGLENSLYIRGDESQSWVPLTDLYLSQNKYPGDYIFMQSVELSKALRDAGQQFSTSTQLQWSQSGVFPAGTPVSLNGYSFDDVKLYTVSKDIYVKEVVNPMEVDCDFGNAEDLILYLTNTHLDTLQNSEILYRLDGGSWNTYPVPLLYADSTHTISIASALDVSAIGIHKLDIIVHHPDDSYRDNDSLLDISILHQPLIDSFPYIEDFESDDGYYFSGGYKSTWSWDSPASNIINRSASGDRCWNTSATGYLPSSEAYLESPCIDVSGLAQPYLSFNMMYDFEDCDTFLCDAAWLEYSTDGVSWNRLDRDTLIDSSWYSSDFFPVWTGVQNQWRSYSVALPKSSKLKLRWRIVSDIGLNKEGIAIDDIHVYDLDHQIFRDTANGTYTSTLTPTSGWNSIIESGDIHCAIDPQNSQLGALRSTLYTHNLGIRTVDNTYLLDRNWTLQPSTPNLADTARVQFYVSQEDIDAAVTDESCPFCLKPRDFADIEILEFASLYDSLENNIFYDNLIGSTRRYTREEIKKVPYLDGYYFEIPVSHFSEFWLVYGRKDTNNLVDLNFENITADNINNDYAQVKWEVSNEYNNHHFEVERATGNQGFAADDWQTVEPEILSQGNNTYAYYTHDDKTIADHNQVYYYRIKSISNAGTSKYSEAAPVVFGTGLPWQLYPNPFTSETQFYLQLPRGTEVYIDITDATGRRVQSMSTTATGYPDHIKFGSGLSAGIYHLRIHTEGREETYILNKM